MGASSEIEMSKEALARALRDQLEHQRRHHGVRYVARPAPSELPVEARAHGPDRPTVRGEPTEAVALETGQGSQAQELRSGVSVEAPAAQRSDAQTWSSAQKLEYLRLQVVGDCQRCGLSRTRKNVVFGVGDPDAKVMFVGEAPGADEDRLGEPFVGAAGQRLTAWLHALGVERSAVYIANVLKCRPPGNRDPEPREVMTCSPFVRAQIRAVQPRVLVALGRYAGNLLAGREDVPLRVLRETRLEYRDPKHPRAIELIVTYHPSYVLRQAGAPTGGRGPAADTALDRQVLDDLRRALAIAAAITT